MLITPAWALLISFFLILWRPLIRCIAVETNFSASCERWVLFFIILVPFVFPLHTVTIGGCGLPFRWELTIACAATLSLDDARGALTIFTRYIRPAIEPAVIAIRDALDAIFGPGLAVNEQVPKSGGRSTSSYSTDESCEDSVDH